MSRSCRDLEVAEKLKHLRDYMDAHDLGGVILGRQDDFAWLTAGGDNHCARDTEVGVASLVVTGERQYVVTSNIEVERLLTEELPGGFEPLVHPWHEGPGSIFERLLNGSRAASDYPVPGCRMLFGELPNLRGCLTRWEMDRYRVFGPVVAEAVERACLEIEPGMTEHAVESRVVESLADRGFSFPVVLVGADERILRYRHPIPTDRRVERRCMVVVCARSGGLTVALTRIVQFGPVPDSIRQRHDAVTAVDAALIAGSRAGRGYAEVLHDGIRAYRLNGFEDEWRQHHQGGPIGYQTREFLVTPETKEVIPAAQAVAWNPSIQGTKSEDTILVTEFGPEIITRGSGEWPMVSVRPEGTAEPLPRPDISCR